METLGKIFTYVKYGIFAVVAVAVGISLFSESTPKIDLAKVLDRTNLALKSFQGHLTASGAKEVNKADMAKLPKVLQQALNNDPKFYSKPIGVKLLKDASFEGFTDENMNNIKDETDSKLFNVEIDFEGNRLIATGTSGRSTGMGLATGFLAGMLMGRLMGRQRSAGVKPGSFKNRKVESRSSYARSRARAGGRFGGK